MDIARPGFTTSLMGDFPMDPRFICSGRIMPMTNNLSTRLDGLINNEVYEVMVVAIDTYGNPKPSMMMEGTPLVTQNPIEAFCDPQGNCPTGFGCSVTGAGTGSGRTSPSRCSGWRDNGGKRPGPSGRGVRDVERRKLATTSLGRGLRARNAARGGGGCCSTRVASAPDVRDQVRPVHPPPR
jgi:hypothetical protein